MINPKRPRTDEKISMTKILTNLNAISMPHKMCETGYASASTHKLGSAASANAALDPLMPTLTPQIRLHIPTSSPLQKSA